MKILSRPKGNAEEYGRWAVNPYLGCPNRCQYCYLKTGPGAKKLGSPTIQMKAGVINEEHACLKAMIEILENREQIVKDGGLFFTFTSDPLLCDTRDVCLTIAFWAIHHSIPVTILTKSASFYTADDSGDPSLLDLPYINQIIHQERHIWTPVADPDEPDLRRIALGWTLTGHDELEPRADSNGQRIVAMRDMAAAGFKTWASIEPVIDFKSSYDMILAACDAGCRHFKIGLMTKNTKVCRKMYDHDACIEFIHDVMQVMEAGGGTATVYWKQSFRDFLGEEDFARATVGYKNIVDKDWSMFK